MNRLSLVSLICVGALSVTACSNAGGGTSSSTLIPTRKGISFNSGSGSTPITHIVLIIQENRTFNDLFATFPGVTGVTVGEKRVKVSGQTIDEPVYLKEVHLTTKVDLNHSYSGFFRAYDNGKMDAFNQVRFRANKPEGELPYEYVYPDDVKPYWTMAEEWGLANAMFTTQGSASYTGHQQLIRGGTEISYDASMIDNPHKPNASGYANGWGCDSPSGTTTNLITTSLQLEKAAGPFPCTLNFPASINYATLRDLLDTAGVSWKYYTPQFISGTGGAIWNAFDTIAPVRYGSEWGTNVVWPETTIFTDISNGALPAMSWVIPNGQNSDHPGDGSDTGPSWVASVVNAIGNSQYWDSTAIIVVWDDWGGFYDSVPPPLPRDNQGGPGLRVPMIVISPYARETSSSQPGYISQTIYEFGSIIQYIEDTFNLGRLGTTDSTTNSMSDMFDYNQTPRAFQTIGSKYSRSYFLHQKPSRIPVDTE